VTPDRKRRSGERFGALFSFEARLLQQTRRAVEARRWNGLPDRRTAAIFAALFAPGRAGRRRRDPKEIA
jgi:hypothetical protein